MKTSHVLRSWGRILQGRAPALSIEITRECPLSCPGCYAYEPNHLGGERTLRQLADFRGEELVRRVLRLIEETRPLHVSLVGGDPLVRYRELEKIVPALIAQGIHVQVVTSAFRPPPRSWAALPLLNLVVSIDGLEEEHNARRSPATYARILKNIESSRITVHCTVTRQMAERPGSLAEFLRLWSDQVAVQRIWFSVFTPQRGASPAERLSAEQRQRVVEELLALRAAFPKLDMAPSALRQFLKPPASPSACIFAKTTRTVSADLRTPVLPCQLGGDPDCAECGCIAAMGLAAVGAYRVGGLIPAGALFHASHWLGQKMGRLRRSRDAAPELVQIEPVLSGDSGIDPASAAP
ncbi:MAG: radical SAM protein [Bryobacteraceae bacterium]|nr:radical SAM protein [Bryobacteraceae bacterium]